MKQIKTHNAFVGDHVIVEYEIFTNCDKACSYCYNVSDTDPRRYNNSLINIVNSLRRIMEMDNKKIIIELIGGEVLLHKYFEEIMQYLYDNQHEDHKFIVFTHADHKKEFFIQRMELLKKFGDKIKISCTLHTEGLNKDQFRENMLYVDNNFQHSNLFFFTDNEYLNDIEYLETIFDSLTTTKLVPIALDHSDRLELAHQLVNMNTKFEKYLDKMDTTYEIDGVVVPYNKGKYQIFKANRLVFLGGKCKIRGYEVNRQGDISMCCFESDQQPLGNLFNDTSTNLLNSCTIICKQKKCQMNMINLEIEIHNEK